VLHGYIALKTFKKGNTQCITELVIKKKSANNLWSCSFDRSVPCHSSALHGLLLCHPYRLTSL